MNHSLGKITERKSDQNGKTPRDDKKDCKKETKKSEEKKTETQKEK